MRSHAHLATRIASSVCGLVFLALLVSAVLGILAIRAAGLQTKASVGLSQQYEYVERQLWKEASLVRVHGLDWQNADWYANLYAERSAADAVTATLNDIATQGSAIDRRLALQTLANHARYVDLLRELFAQIDARSPASTETFDKSTRLFDVMQTRIDQRASQQHTAATASLAESDTLQARVLKLTLIAAFIGIGCLAVSWYVIMRYRRAIERARSAEMLRLAEVSQTDPLTGLGNHRAYQDELERELARNERHGGSLSLALIDVDNFKAVNDKQGHIKGDAVLATLGTLLLGLRKSDRGFRLGGDEFAVVLPHTELNDATVTMERLRLEAQAKLSGSTISIGISSTEAAKLDAVTLREQADAALYAAKHRGRNSTMTYSEARSHAFVRSTEKEHAIRQLICDGRVEVVFQAIWDVRTGAPLGFEALVRPDVSYGLSGPQEAFDLAEEMGLAAELDTVALKAIFMRAGELPGETLLFLNVVPETLTSKLFTSGEFLTFVAAAGIARERIVIEVTERSMRDLDAIVRQAKHLQDLGLRIALDDTGAGNAGLDVLRKLSVDFVKIDRGVIVQAITDPIARAIVTGIIEIARAMGSYVIAEGVETAEALRFVCCNIAHAAADEIAIGGVQGYLFGTPDSTPWHNPSWEQSFLLLGDRQSRSPAPR